MMVRYYACDMMSLTPKGLIIVPRLIEKVRHRDVKIAYMRHDDIAGINGLDAISPQINAGDII